MQQTTITDDISQIKEIVARVYDIFVSDIDSRRRMDHLCRARRTSMHICYARNLGTFKFIGRHHGKKNHGTVLHAVRKAAKNIEQLPEFRKKYDECLALVDEALAPVQVFKQDEWPGILNPPVPLKSTDPRQMFIGETIAIYVDPLLLKAS